MGWHNLHLQWDCKKKKKEKQKKWVKTEYVDRHTDQQDREMGKQWDLSVHVTLITLWTDWWEDEGHKAVFVRPTNNDMSTKSLHYKPRSVFIDRLEWRVSEKQGEEPRYRDEGTDAAKSAGNLGNLRVLSGAVIGKAICLTGSSTKYDN